MALRDLALLRRQRRRGSVCSVSASPTSAVERRAQVVRHAPPSSELRSRSDSISHQRLLRDVDVVHALERDRGQRGEGLELLRAARGSAASAASPAGAQARRACASAPSAAGRARHCAGSVSVAEAGRLAVVERPVARRSRRSRAAASVAACTQPVVRRRAPGPAPGRGTGRCTAARRARRPAAVSSAADSSRASSNSDCARALALDAMRPGSAGRR